MRINIIGGGLAGCALAYIAKQAGLTPVICDAAPNLASGASGNDVGLYNPRFTAQYDAVGEFYSHAFNEASRVFEAFGDAIEWSPCGALHLITNDMKARRFPKTVASWGWAPEDMRIVSASEASDLSGVEIPLQALFLTKSGKISPKKLCQEYARDVECHLNTPIQNIKDLDGDVTVIACGMGALNFDQAAHLPLKPVRGQVTTIKASQTSAHLKMALCYGGYIAPAHKGAHCLGATFQRWLDHADVIDQDDQDNLQSLFAAIPALQAEYDVVSSRAGIRTTTKDHFPIVGELERGLYISAGHGSHGILSSLLSAKIIVNNIMEKQGDVSQFVLGSLIPGRFYTPE